MKALLTSKQGAGICASSECSVFLFCQPAISAGRSNPCAICLLAPERLSDKHRAWLGRNFCSLSSSNLEASYCDELCILSMSVPQ
jgi:hypothetical protein